MMEKLKLNKKNIEIIFFTGIKVMKKTAYRNAKELNNTILTSNVE